jgi:GT2 family glycosyltransferase
LDASAADPIPGVSVIVPVYNNPIGLLRCLDSLTTLDYPPDRYEIVVVDNGSEPGADEVTSKFPSAKLVHEAEPGSYGARNRGIEEASRSVIAFTDSDCIADPQWLANGVRALCSGDNDAVGGHIDLTFVNPQKPQLSELYDKYFLNLRQKELVLRSKFAATANLFVRRSVFAKIGRFNDNLRSLGDKEFGNRLTRSGLKLVYCPDAIIHHPARKSFSDLAWKARRVVGGDIDLRRITARYPFAEFLYDVVRHVRPPVRILPFICRKEPSLDFFGRGLLFFPYIMLLRLIIGIEAVRVYFGGRSSRR